MPSSEAGKTGPVWRNASFSASGKCIEVIERDSVIIMRESRNPSAVACSATLTIYRRVASFCPWHQKLANSMT